MNKSIVLLILTILFFSCKNESSINTENESSKYLVDEIPINIPLTFKQELVPEGTIIHKGIFSPDLNEYYYTLSDQNFSQFNVYVIQKENGQWSKPKMAFFNSQYNEHGMSFSPDGNTLFFSSTRPTLTEEVDSTWHIWKIEKVYGKWMKPKFVDIPNCRNKLATHPTITKSGKIYFQLSNLDYSATDIYYSSPKEGQWSNAEKLSIKDQSYMSKCTPHVGPNDDYIIFAAVEQQMDLMICTKDENGDWKNLKKLSDKITNGQGNPFITPDHKFLFYTSSNPNTNVWSVKWLDVEKELQHF